MTDKVVLYINGAEVFNSESNVSNANSNTQEYIMVPYPDIGKRYFYIDKKDNLGKPIYKEGILTKIETKQTGYGYNSTPEDYYTIDGVKISTVYNKLKTSGGRKSRKSKLQKSKNRKSFRKKYLT